MEKFLALIKEDINLLKQIGEEGRYKNMRDAIHWVESLTASGNYSAGEPLMLSGKYVSRDYVLSDGPFIEAKEVISGYFFLHAENIEQAVFIAQSCPLVEQDKMVIEIRPIMTINNTLMNE